MFDTVCKFLIENFPSDFATWLLGEPVELVTISPSELSIEPIRADALILLQSQNLVLHIDFQTLPRPNIPFRMLDYRVRVYRRFPDKTMRQVVIYLQRTQSELAWQTTFSLENTQHQFEVIRLWEQPLGSFLNVPGLLPFAVLSQADNPADVLQQVAERIQRIPERTVQSNLTATAAILSALVLDKTIVQRILRSDLMHESAIYQEIKAEGKAEGIAEGFQKAVQRERALVLRLLSLKIGTLPEAEQKQISQLSLDQLEILIARLSEFSTVEGLSNWLQSDRLTA